MPVLAAQRGYLLPWLPVALGTGIALYFALPAEPGRAAWGLCGAGFALAGLLAWRLPAAVRPAALGLAALLAGLLLAGLRSHLVSAPVLYGRYYGPVEGRIVAIDRSISDVPRLTLDRVVLADLPPGRTPHRVRVALHGPPLAAPEPGMVVILTGHLAPPEGPVAPGAYDFRRQAWFDGLGAVGYTRSPVLLLRPAPPGPDLWFARARMRLSAWVQRELPGQPGAFAATLITGDRSGLTRATQDDLRNSNLSHILSISGLHMVLLTGSVFAALRLALALIPPLALRLPIRKLAAVAALAAGLFYYLLSGREVPAERAYVMVAVMFLALIADRRAISLRSVAVAGIAVLALRPESVTEPGFQMSFSATVALVAAFDLLRRLPRLPRWAAPVVATVLSSAVAGAATAPFAAAHFNRMADYGLLANLLSVPLMGLFVMPAALVTAVLAPFGLGGWGLMLMDWPLRWVLGVASWVAGLEGAVTRVPAPPAAVLPLLSLGGLLLVLWQGRLRWAGLAPMALAALLWQGAERPVLLVSGDGGLIGVLGPQGRALSKPRGQGFAAQSWLEDDGDAAGQEEAAGRPGLERSAGEVRVTLPGLELRQFSGRGAAGRAAAACGSGALLVLASDAPPDLPAGCRMLDAAALALTGALALSAGPDGPVLHSVRDSTGLRPWSQPHGRPRPAQPPALRLSAATP